METVRDELFRLTRREAEAGARIVLWSEVNAIIGKGERESFLSRAAQAAREAEIYLLVAFARLDSEHGSIENKAVLLSPDGGILFEYLKARPAPGELSTPVHAQMAIFRGVENGYSIFRQTNEGLSIAADPQGRVIARMNHFNTDDRVLRAHVPVEPASESPG
jgi:apolipoprotein N-acyltransferase